VTHDVRRALLRDGLLALLGVVLLLGLYPVGLGAESVKDTEASGTGRADVQVSPNSFGISGNASEPISPGVMVPLNLLLTNPHDFGISVADLSVAVTLVSAPNASLSRPCGVADFVVDQTMPDLNVTVAAHTSGTLESFHLEPAIWPHVGMVDRSVNQDGCQGATLTLRFTASGSRVV
jgi:hypothetical protein